MDVQAAVALKSTLQGVTLPAEKPALLEYAVRQHAQPVFLSALQSLPERAYESLDDVAEQLMRVQPPRDQSKPSQPNEESGEPPGGDDYVRPYPSETGQVPDLDRAAD